MVRLGRAGLISPNLKWDEHQFGRQCATQTGTPHVNCANQQRDGQIRIPSIDEFSAKKCVCVCVWSDPSHCPCKQLQSSKRFSDYQTIGPAFLNDDRTCSFITRYANKTGCSSSCTLIPHQQPSMGSLSRLVAVSRIDFSAKFIPSQIRNLGGFLYLPRRLCVTRIERRLVNHTCVCFQTDQSVVM